MGAVWVVIGAIQGMIGGSRFRLITQVGNTIYTVQTVIISIECGDYKIMTASRCHDHVILCGSILCEQYMESVTITLEERHIERLDELTGEDGRFSNRSEAVRGLIDQDSDIEELRVENERLKNEKQTLIAQREETQELKEYISDDQRIRREERKRQKAPIWKRIYWIAFGEGDQNILSAADVKGKLMPQKDENHDDREEFECDRCGTGGFSLPEVRIDNYRQDDEEVICPDCLTVEDRVID